MSEPDLKNYSVHRLLASGSRFTEDFNEEDAIAMYLELHPEAKEHEVRAELQKEIGLRQSQKI